MDEYDGDGGELSDGLDEFEASHEERAKKKVGKNRIWFKKLISHLHSYETHRANRLHLQTSLTTRHMK